MLQPSNRVCKYKGHSHQVFFDFLGNVVNAGVQAFVIPFPAPSRLAADRLVKLGLCGQVDLVHIDAAHGYDDVLEDIRLWWPLVKHGGVLLGDDWNWPRVRSAVFDWVSTESGGETLYAFKKRKWYVVKGGPPMDCACPRPGCLPKDESGYEWWSLACSTT